MIRIKLGAEDRERVGAPEVLQYDPYKPKLREVRELKRQCKLTTKQLYEALAEADVEAAGIVVWLALLRAGVAVAWEDFDLDFDTMVVEEVEEDPNPSAPSGASTN